MPIDKDEMLAKYQQGQTMQEIAQAYNISQPSVSRILNKIPGFVARRRGPTAGPHKVFPVEELFRAVVHLESTRKAAERLGCDHGTISKRRREHIAKHGQPDLYATEETVGRHAK
jgi:transposase-like protein